MAWSVYATGWRTDRIIDELPAFGIEFTRQISEHGQCTFELPIPRGGAAWLPIVRPWMTGILVCEDTEVRWGGVVMSRPRSGERTYRVDAVEWGVFLDRQLISPNLYVADGFVQWDEALLVEQLARMGTSRVGADWPLTVEATRSGRMVDLVEDVQPDSFKSVMELIRDVCGPEGAPEWALSVEGTAAHPRRILRVAPRLGRPTVAQSHVVLDYVADVGRALQPHRGPSKAATVLDALYPVPGAVWGRTERGTRTRRHGGNVLVDPGDDLAGADAATRVWSLPEPTDLDEVKGPGVATADAHLTAGYPLLETQVQAPAARTATERHRYAAGALAARLGFQTGWRFSTFATDPALGDWQLGDQARVHIDSDAYTYTGPGRDPKPLTFEVRLTGCEVRPDDNSRDASAGTGHGLGGAVVNYTTVTPATLDAA